MHGKRNYTALDYINWVEDEYVTHVLESAGVRRGRSQHAKQEWDARYHEPHINNDELDQKLKQHPDLAEMSSSWNAGAKDASHLAEKIGLRHGISDDHWMDPWAGTNEKLHVWEADPVQSDSSSSSDDEDVYLPPHVPPPFNTTTLMDVRVVSVQVIRQRTSVNQKTLWKVTKLVDKQIM